MTRTVNLIPIALLRRAENRRLAGCWALVWLVTMGLFSLGQAALRHSIDRAKAEHRRLAHQAAPLRKIQADTQAANRQADSLEQRLVRQHALEQAETPLALLQTIAMACDACQGAITLDSYEMLETAGPAQAGSANPSLTPAPRKQLILLGSAETDDDISQLVQQIRSSQVFTSVNLDSTQTAGDFNSSERTFRLTCQQ